VAVVAPDGDALRDDPAGVVLGPVRRSGSSLAGGGIGIDWPNPRSNPQIPVRAHEVERITASGQHRNVVAIDVDCR
jgi:hypothetical protein